MLDCGIKLNEKPEYPIDVPDIDAFILSHAHLDHCGAAPTIYNSQLVPSFGTQPTLEFSELLLEDSLQVAKKEHLQPKFHKRQIRSFSNRYVPLEYGNTADFKNIAMTFHDAGHICGSSVVEMIRKDASTNKRVVYTGDYKLEPQLLHKGAKIIESDILITESTYATREHPPREQVMAEVITRVKEVLQNGGNALLPTFAVGRSQELIAMLHKNGLSDITYLDGMARAATKIALRHKDFLDNWSLLHQAASNVVFVEHPSDRKEALSSPSVIVTTAGMLNGGPAMDYIPRLNRNSEILLTGYQVDGSNGHHLLKHGTIKIDGSEEKVLAKASYYDLSAHAGKAELYEYVKKSSPSIVFCVHGDKEASLAMAENLKLEGYEAYAPQLGEVIKIE